MLRTLYQLIFIECQVSLASCRVSVREGVERNDRGCSGGSSQHDIQYLHCKRLLIGDGLEDVFQSEIRYNGVVQLGGPREGVQPQVSLYSF